MKEGDLLFVYGSLRKGECSDLTNNPSATYVGEDKINGLLYGVSWFPGVKLLSDNHPYSDEDGKVQTKFFGQYPQVVGDVFRLDNASIIAGLDDYEDYPRLYNRFEVQTAEGRTVWVYTFNGSVSEDARVKCGDWLLREQPHQPIQTAA